MLPSEQAGDGFGQVQSVSSHKVKKNFFAPSETTSETNLATAKPYIGLGMLFFYLSLRKT